MSDEKRPLILHSGSGLALVRPQGGRIVAEMVSGALANARPQDLSVSDEKLTAEQWFQRGESHYYGWKANQSYAEAARCYRTAAEQGHLDAACNLGCLLTLGLGVAKDPIEAVRLSEHAAVHGHAVGLFNLSHHYQVGMAVPLTHKRGQAKAYRAIGNYKEYKNPAEWMTAMLIATVEYAGVTLTGDMLNYDDSLQFDPQRTDKFVTFYEIVLPTMQALESRPLDANDELSFLRKVRLEEIPCSGVSGHVLVVDSGHSWLMNGDLLPLPVFKALNCVWDEERKRRLNRQHFGKAIVLSTNLDGAQYDELLSEHIIGRLDGGRIELKTAPQYPSHLREVIGSLHQRGLGVRQSDAEASKWYALAGPITELNCSYNQRTKLDLSAVPQLTRLDCRDNRLTSLDLSFVPRLDWLRCDGNPLAELDIRPLARLKNLLYDRDKTRLIQRPDQHF